MKALIIFLFTISSITMLNAQNSQDQSIKKVILAFAKAGDTNNAEDLNIYLDDNYRVVMNRLFGSNDVTVMSRDMYIEKIRSKEFGGDSRTVKFHSITVNGNTASVRVTMTGTKMTFHSILNLIQNKDGQWKLISDMPVTSI